MDLNKIKKSFNSFLDEKVARLEAKQKVAIVAAAIALPAALFYFMLYSPKQKEIDSLQRKRTRIEQEVKKLEATAKKLDEHKAQMAATEKQFKMISVLLPEQKEIPSLLTNISSLATNSGLDVITFKPGGERAKEFYAEIPVNIQVKGSYHNIGYFLYQVSRLPRIVTVPDIRMSSPKKVAGEMQLNTALNLLTYRFIEHKENDEKGKKKRKKK